MNLADLDIVYMVKDAVYNDELRYSLRSVSKNFPHKQVWFVGGKPMYAHPDKQIIVNQKGDTKWDKVRAMLEMVAKENRITEDFVLFNDDFFVLRPVENLPAYAYGTLEELCHRIERKNGGRPTKYTLNIKRTIDALKENNLTTLNFELHLPIILNRKKLMDVIRQFPNTKGTRSLYGNTYLSSSIEPLKDVKVYDADSLPTKEQTFVSTDDHSFACGKVGELIKSFFPEKSRFEH